MKSPVNARAHVAAGPRALQENRSVIYVYDCDHPHERPFAEVIPLDKIPDLLSLAGSGEPPLKDQVEPDDEMIFRKVR